MSKKINYVKCTSCEYKLSQDYYDPHTDLCKQCNNTREVQDPKDILCNMCGRSMCPLGAHNEQYPHGLHKAVVSGGYDSYHLSDCTSYIFSFCEKCLRQLFMKCIIPPTTTNSLRNLSDQNDWLEDLKWYEYKVWSDEGGAHAAYLSGKCNQEKDCQNDAVYSIFNSDEFTESSSCEEHKKKYQETSQSLKKFVPNSLKSFL